MAAANHDDDQPDTSPRRGRLPPLSMVRAFEAVGRLGSMRKAADDLSLSHSVVSRHVHNLEAWLGTRLVEAGPRGVRLTPEGALFAGAIGNAFDLIAKSTAELRPVQHRSTLKIWCMPGLATRWLAPRIHLLQQALPDIDFLIRPTDLTPDFSHFEADAHITFADEAKDSACWALLERPRMFPVASPDWIAAHKPVTDLNDLARQPLIHEESWHQWRNWFKASNYGTEITLKGPRLWSANMTMDAAARGEGIALATGPIAVDAIRDGVLVELLQTNVQMGAYYFVAAKERWNERKLQSLLKWLVGAMAEPA